MSKQVCSEAKDCRAPCVHKEPHEPNSEELCHGSCYNPDGIAGGRCEPYSDLTHPLRPPRGPKSYVCNEAGECGVSECSAAKSHTHSEPIIHEPRRCRFTQTRVRCEEEPILVRCDAWKDCEVESCPHITEHGWASAGLHKCEAFKCLETDSRVRCNPIPSAGPLRGVYFSGKAIEVLSMLNGMDPADWDKLWAMVTGKTQDADLHGTVEELAEKAERDGNEGTMTPAVWEESVRAIIVEELGLYDNWAWTDRLDRATARIMKLPPREKP